MRKRNHVSQLNRTASHRKAMMRNMVTSLFEHESVVTTRARGKVLKSYAEKIITKAKRNLEADVNAQDKLHNVREIYKHVANSDIVHKLIDDIAPRYKERAGGYTRMIHLPERKSDASQMSIVELIDKKTKARKQPLKETKATTKPRKDETKSKSGSESERKKDKDDRKWYWRFKKDKKEG